MSKVLGAIAAFLMASGPAYAADFDPTIRIGVLTDFSSVYKDNTGDGSYVAAQMAVDDFLAQYPDTILKPVLLRGDHQNKADVGLQIARQWFDQGVDVAVDLANSAVALGVSGLGVADNKVVIVTSAGSTDLTGKACNANTIQWGFDNYGTVGAVKSLVESGLKKWVLHHGGLYLWP